MCTEYRHDIYRSDLLAICHSLETKQVQDATMLGCETVLISGLSDANTQLLACCG